MEVKTLKKLKTKFDSRFTHSIPMLEDSGDYSTSNIISDDLYYKMILDLLRSAGPDRNAEIVQKVMNELDLRLIDERSNISNKVSRDDSVLEDSLEDFRLSHRRSSNDSKIKEE